MDENEEFEFRLRAEQEAAPAAAPVTAPDFLSQGGLRVREALKLPFQVASDVGKTALDAAMGIPEVLTEGATGLAAKVASGFAGAATGSPETVEAVQNDLTYQPRSRTADLIKEGLAQVAKPFQAVAAPLDEAVAKLPAGPRTAIEAGTEAATDIIGLAVPGSRPARAAARGALPESAPVAGAARASQDDVLGTLRAAGYKFRPSDVQAMKPGEKVSGLKREALQDPAGLRKDFTLENQATTTRLAGQDLGLKDAKSLMEKDYEKLRKPHFETYTRAEDAAARAPSPEYADTLLAGQERAGLKSNASVTETIGALRRNARKRARSDDIKVNKEGDADQAAADALESALEKQLTTQGDAKLIADYRAARKELAKIHDYESATRGGQVDAQILRRLDKRSPGRMAGNAKIISDAADYGKNVVRHSSGATGTRSSVKADSIVGATRNLAGKAISKLPGMDVSRPSFQNKFGREATEAERATFADYGRRERIEPPPPARDPQLDFELLQSLGLEPPPGVTPSRLAEPPAPTITEQFEALGPLMDLVPPAGATPTRIMPSVPQPGVDMLGELLELVAPNGVTPSRVMPPTPSPNPSMFPGLIDLAPPPGKVGKPLAPKKKAKK